MADINANSKAGDHEDLIGKFRVFWANDGWYYIDYCEIGHNDQIDIADASGPYDTSDEAEDAASAYGC